MTPPTRRVLQATLIVGGALAVAVAIFLFVMNRRLWSEVVGRPWRNPTEIHASDGMHILDVYGEDWRTTTPVLLEDLPEHVPAAFMAAEDVRFRRHFGVDPIGVGRAAFANLRRGGISQGGSTITQQLVKNKVLSAKKSFARKIPEAILAIGLELRVSKDDILEAYLNDIYLGHVDGQPVEGVTEAARLYFDKRPEKLTPADSALLAAMVRAPNRDNPDKRPEVVHTRRDAILRIMSEKRWIAGDAYQRARAEPVRLDPGAFPPTPYRHYLDALRFEAIEKVGERRLARGGLKIHAGIDPLLQISAEKAARNGTRALSRRHTWLRRADQPLQAAVFSLDPRSGSVRAIVGGSDYRVSKLDRTALMRRQPGSTFKPFVYLAAIESRDFTAGSLLRDEPLELELARNDTWRPKNFDERFRGQVTLREAFEKSLNVPAVRVADQLGTRPIRRLVDRLKFDGELSETPALALGVSEVSMRDLTAAYTIFPNLGLRTEPHFIDRIEDGKRTIYEYRGEGTRIVDAPAAFVLHTLLRGVVLRGTASRLADTGFAHVAGKTGTTNDYRDAWFVGYSQKLITTVWVGFDETLALRLSSAESALPIWAKTMQTRNEATGEIATPEGVSVIPIEPGTGRRWRPGCGERLSEFFLTGTEPAEFCREGATSSVLARFEEPRVGGLTVGEGAGRAVVVRDDEGDDDRRFRRLSREERERTRRHRRPPRVEDDDEDDDERFEKILERRDKELRAEMREWKKKHRKQPKPPKSRGRVQDDEDDDDDD